METRVAIIAILVKDRDSSCKINEILHEYGEYIIGRLGLPYKQKGVHIISIAIDAPQDTVAALSGKIGALKDVSVQTLYSKI